MEDNPARVANAAGEDAGLDETLRPKRLADYIGQPSVHEQMSIFITAASRRAEAMDHTLIFGPPGLGKTTLAHIIASELGVGLRQTSGPVLERPGDLAALLTNLEPRDVLFIDEIHTILGAGSAQGTTVDASNMLKPKLASGTLRCIGATTFQEYRGSIERDRALCRLRYPQRVPA